MTSINPDSGMQVKYGDYTDPNLNDAQEIADQTWENIADSMSASTYSSVKYDPAAGAPILPNANLQSINQVNVKSIATPASLNQAGMTAFETTIAKNISQTMEDMEGAAEVILRGLPPSHPETVTIKEFLLAIRSAIDELKRTLATIRETEAKKSIEQTKAGSEANFDKIDQAGKKLEEQQKKAKISVAEGVQARQEERSQRESAGKMKTLNTALKIIQPIATWFSGSLLVSAPLAILSIIDSAPGPTQGFLNKITEKLNELVEKIIPEDSHPGLKALMRLALMSPLILVCVVNPILFPVAVFIVTQELKYTTEDMRKFNLRQADDLKTQINECGEDEALIASLKSKTKMGEAEEAIFDMVRMLMKLLAQILLGLQTGTVDIESMQKALGKIVEKPLPEELKGKIEEINKKMEGFSIDLTGKTDGSSESAKATFKEAMKWMTLYSFYRSKEDNIGAEEALRNVERILCKVAQEVKETSVFQNQMSVMSEVIYQKPNGANQAIAQHSPA